MQGGQPTGYAHQLRARLQSILSTFNDIFNSVILDSLWTRGSGMELPRQFFPLFSFSSSESHKGAAYSGWHLAPPPLPSKAITPNCARLFPRGIQSESYLSRGADGRPPVLLQKGGVVLALCGSYFKPKKTSPGTAAVPPALLFRWLRSHSQP